MTDEKLPSIHDAFDEARKAMNIINAMQATLWHMHHTVKLKDEALGTRLWEISLQIEYALKVLNEEIFAGDGYWGEEIKRDLDK